MSKRGDEKSEEEIMSDNTRFTTHDRAILMNEVAREAARESAQRAIEEIDSLRKDRDEWKRACESTEATHTKAVQMVADGMDPNLIHGSLQAPLKQLRSELERTKNALRLIQWGGENHMGRYCPKCRRYKSSDHAPDCEVGAALAGETATSPIAKELFQRLSSMSPGDRYAFVERFNAISDEEAKEMVRQYREQETGGAA